MQALDVLEIDHLSVGLTKPPTKFGVPLVAFYSNMIFGVYGWMLYQLISGDYSLMGIMLIFLISILIHIAMVIVSFRDPFGIRIYWLNLVHFQANWNRKMWGNTDSYQP